MPTPSVRHTWSLSSSGTVSTAGIDTHGWGRDIGVYVQTDTAAGSSATVLIQTARSSTSPGFVLGTINLNAPSTASHSQYEGPFLFLYPRVDGVSGTVTVEVIGN